MCVVSTRSCRQVESLAAFVQQGYWLLGAALQTHFRMDTSASRGMRFVWAVLPEACVAWNGGSGLHGQHGRAARASSDTLNGDACVDVRSVLDRLGACLQIARVATVKEMPVSASLPPPSVHLPKRPHVCSAAQLELMEADVDSCPWRDEYVTVPPDVRDGHRTVPTLRAGVRSSTRRQWPPGPGGATSCSRSCGH